MTEVQPAPPPRRIAVTLTRGALRLLWSLVALSLVASILATIAIIVVAVEYDQRQRGMCQLVGILAPATPAPTTSRGADITRAASRYVRDNCR